MKINWSKKWMLAAVSVLLVIAMFSGCSRTDGNSVEASNTLVYGSGDYTAINPALYEHGEINLLLFSGLTAHDSENQIVSGLAESWEFDASTCTYTFHLREDVQWHDGEPFTARDVKFTLESIMNPENASEIASNYEEVTQIQISDERTVQISLSAPNAAMLDYLTVGILPAHLLEGKDLATDDFNRNPVGTGPYRLVSWDQGQSICLERNENYFGGIPKIEQIIFKIVTDEKVRAMQLKSGELDLAQISPQDAEQFRSDDHYQIYEMKTADYRGILYNFNHPFFQKYRELPAALSYAVDRQAIVDSVLLGHGEVAYSPLQMSFYNDSEVEHYDYQPKQTELLLQQNGWVKNSDGIYEKNGDPLAFAINCSEGDQMRIDMATICAQQLREIGADVSVKVNAQIDWEGQEAYLIGWGSPFDPDDHTYKVFGTDKGANYSGYSNLEVDRLLQQARETDQQEERRLAYQQFQQVLADDPAFTYLAYVDAIYVGNTAIHGITPETVLGHHGVGIFWNLVDWTLE